MRINRITVVLILMFLVIIFANANTNTKTVKVRIHDKRYTFEIAETQEERQKGLMFRKKLDQNSGMLFIFDRTDYLTFYMKDTFIPLDIAFIDSDFTIVDIQQLQPLDETLVISKFKAQYALEVNRRFFEKAGLSVGDKFELITTLGE